MAASKLPGWQSQLQLGQIDDGTSCLAPSSSPGIVGQHFDTQHGRLRRGASIGARIQCVEETCALAILIAPMEIRTELDDDISQVLDSLLPGILQMLKVISISTGVGAAAGALVGAGAGGIGALPGAAVGGVIGFEVAMAVLTWMGLGFLIASVAANLHDFDQLVADAGKMAWEAAEYVDPFQNQQINLAARKLAQASAVLVTLILQAIVALLLKKVGEFQIKKLAQAPSFFKGSDITLANKQAALEVATELRKSKLGGDFADWVEKNSERLLNEPNLSVQRVNQGKWESGMSGSSPSKLSTAESTKSQMSTPTGLSTRTSSLTDDFPTSKKLTFDNNQLKAKFKHARFFGVSGNYNSANAIKFQDALISHFNDPGNKFITGTFKKFQPVTFTVNPKNGLNIMTDPDGNFISGWRLSPSQLQNVLTRGKL